MRPRRSRTSALGPLGVGAAAVVLPVPAPGDASCSTSRGCGRASAGRIRAAARATGVHAREGRHGRGGHDDAFLLAAGTPGFGFGTGRCGPCTSAWSGDTELWAERSPLGPPSSAAGELLAPGEIASAAGERYDVAVVRRGRTRRRASTGSPTGCIPWIRSWSTIDRPRPVVLNTWEAVYFDHSLERLEPLIDARRRGRRRAVRARRRLVHSAARDDRRALGDWTVDPAVWPDGLHPLIDARARRRAWSSASGSSPRWSAPTPTLARAHPGLASRPARRGRPGAASACSTWRSPARPHTSSSASTRCSPNTRSRYLKWDHNRDLLVGLRARADARAVPADRPRCAPRTPASRSSRAPRAAARIDLGILRRVDRVWTSDTNDPLERQRDPALDRPRWCRPSTSARTSATRGRTRPAAPPSCRSAWPRRCSAAPASSGDLAARPHGATSRRSPRGRPRTRRLRPLLHTRPGGAGGCRRPGAGAARRRRPRPVARRRTRRRCSRRPAAALAPAVRLPGLDSRGALPREAADPRRSAARAAGRPAALVRRPAR